MQSRRQDFTPIYYRIEESLRMRIAAGEFQEGDPLPSEAELAREFRTTRGTVRQALARLVFEGLIVREVGRGTFVSRRKFESTVDTSIHQSFEEQMESRGSRVTFRLLGFARVPAPAAVATTLRLPSDEPVYRLERLRFVDGELLGLETRYLLAHLGERVPPEALRERSAVELVEVTLGVPLGTIALAVRASTATKDLARKLQIAPGSAVLIREHTFFDLEGRPVLCGEAIYRADKYQITYTLGKGRVPAASAAGLVASGPLAPVRR